MVVNTSIEILKYGNFDIQYTFSIMVSEHKYNVNELFNEFYKQENIKSNKGLNNNELDKITDNFIKFLRSKDFRKFYPVSICFTD